MDTRTEPPTLDAYRYTSKDGDVSLIVWCQYCLRWHWHGAGNAPGDGDGHRSAHCYVQTSPYRQGGYSLHEVGTITKRMMSQRGRRIASTGPAPGGVYIVQLSEQPNTVKIGCSHQLRQRLVGVRRTYGANRLLLLIPHADPKTLEHQLHARFAAMRQYDGASPTELFIFATRAQQQALELLIQEQQAHRIESPIWTTHEHGRRRSVDPRQAPLFDL